MENLNLNNEEVLEVTEVLEPTEVFESMEEVTEESESNNGLVAGLAIGAAIIGVGYGIKKFFDRRKASKVTASETVEVLDDVEKVEPEEIKE